MNYDIAKTVNAKGLICPEPMMMLHTAVRDAKPGDIIEVLATDTTTERDIKQFCEFLDHPLLGKQEDAGVLTFYVQKKEAS